MNVFKINWPDFVVGRASFKGVVAYNWANLTCLIILKHNPNHWHFSRVLKVLQIETISSWKFKNTFWTFYKTKKVLFFQLSSLSSSKILMVKSWLILDFFQKYSFDSILWFIKVMHLLKKQNHLKWVIPWFLRPHFNWINIKPSIKVLNFYEVPVIDKSLVLKTNKMDYGDSKEISRRKILNNSRISIIFW